LLVCCYVVLFFFFSFFYFMSIEQYIGKSIINFDNTGKWCYWKCCCGVCDWRLLCWVLCSSVYLWLYIILCGVCSYETYSQLVFIIEIKCCDYNGMAKMIIENWSAVGWIRLEWSFSFFFGIIVIHRSGIFFLKICFVSIFVKQDICWLVRTPPGSGQPN
jgi:hypothetical protein